MAGFFVLYFGRCLPIAIGRPGFALQSFLMTSAALQIIKKGFPLQSLTRTANRVMSLRAKRSNLKTVPFT